MYDIHFIHANSHITHKDNSHAKDIKGKGHPITGHEGPTGGVEV
jgi:hypothetical protein